jgi:carboxyl-terminal processing protease
MGNKKLGIIFLFTIILTFFAGYFSSRVMSIFPSPRSSELFEYITKKFDELYYYDLDDDMKHEAFIRSMEAIINSYAIDNQDPYTYLIEAPLTASTPNTEKFVGIGIGIRFEGLLVRILDVNKNGAGHGKLFPNDLIIGVKIDQSVIYFSEQQTRTEVSNLLSGQINDEKILIVKNPDGMIHEVSVIYQEVLTPSVVSWSLNETDIGYIKINKFNAPNSESVGTASLFLDYINQIENSILNTNPENKTLIIDLRDNPGGSLFALNHNESSVPGITQQLIQRNLDKPIFQMIGKSGSIQSFYGGLSTRKPYEIVVLVNENSASAAEVLAASLMMEGYTIYGVPTYGKGVFQRTEVLLEMKNRNMQYLMSYTAGSWYYDNLKNVSVNPLNVEEILQSGYLTLTLPIYDGTISFDQVNFSLIPYQAFLNVYLDLNLRTDGYFDIETKHAIELYQTLNGLSVTGQIDIHTGRSIHMIFMQEVSKIENDIQLQTLVNQIKMQP